MSRKNETFDEFCDPDNPREIKYKDVLDAQTRIKPYIMSTPCFMSHTCYDYAMYIYYKPELFHVTGSFKERGAVNMLQRLPEDQKKIGIILASTGNSATGICYYAAKLGIPATVIMPTSIPIAKQQSCLSMGAKVILYGGNVVEAIVHAHQHAKEKGLTYIHGRDHPDVLAGNGTVALEILEQLPFVDAIIVPVGMGGLAAATVAVVKHVKPTCLVYGVQPENVPAFFKSLEVGEPQMVPAMDTIADAIAIPTVGVNSFFNVKDKLDKILLVKEDWIARAVLHLVEKERFVVEGAGACTFAAIIGNLVPELKKKNVVCVLSGGNIDTILLARCLDRGLAAEGRLVKFKVDIKDKPTAIEQLLKLLANSGYSVTRLFQDHVWVEGDVYTVEYKVVCETKGIEHSMELKRLIERAYPHASAFETEPFNDKRACPCYVPRPP